jgi:hypothetical protein
MEETASSENNNFVVWHSGKREKRCIQPLIHILSKHTIDEFCTDTDGTDHVKKRIRLSAEVTSTGLSSTSSDIPAISCKGNSDSCKSKKLDGSSTNGLCHVCRLPYVPSLPLEKPHNMNIQKKTLLSYYQTTLNQSVLASHNSDHIPFPPRQNSCCFFCERSNICRNCLTHCEHCNETFCTLCVTTDYNVSFGRTFCLECVIGSRSHLESKGDDDSMQVEQ